MDIIFLNEKNINTLYEILLQELKINDRSNWIPQIKQIFRNNINFFLANVNLNNSLLELNKLFLKQTIIAINKLIPNLRNEQKKINILPEEINFPHKIEDIKNIRRDLFDEEFNLKKREFDDIMKKETPNTINFSDDYKNEKIINMKQLISDKMNERNNEIPKIENVSEINNILENIKEPITIEFEEINNQEINYKIMNDEEINKKINNAKINNEKKVNEMINEKETLNKKKKVNFNLSETDEIIPEIKTTIYEEQQSTNIHNFLPLKNNNNINNNNNTNITNNVSNFLPMNEFIKKINEIDVLNKKIDNLTNLVEKMIEQQIQINKSGICENGSYI
jgi:hypothetical protein